MSLPFRILTVMLMRLLLRMLPAVLVVMSQRRTIAGGQISDLRWCMKYVLVVGGNYSTAERIASLFAGLAYGEALLGRCSVVEARSERFDAVRSLLGDRLGQRRVMSLNALLALRILLKATIATHRSSGSLRHVRCTSASSDDLTEAFLHR